MNVSPVNRPARRRAVHGWLRHAHAEHPERVAAEDTAAAEQPELTTHPRPQAQEPKLPVRKIIAGMFITLDGVIEAPEKWNPPYYNQEMTHAVQSQIAESDLHLYGRRSYELFRSVFTGPAADRIPHAQIMNQAAKVVVSTTLENPDWGPTTLVAENVAERLTQLKHQPGKNINVGASGTLVRFLLTEGLLDELRLMIHPIVVGSGRHLFAEGHQPVPLALVETTTFSTGVVSAHYQPARR